MHLGELGSHLGGNSVRAKGQMFLVYLLGILYHPLVVPNLNSFCFIVMLRGGLGQHFRPGNLTPIQAMPYTHNRTTEAWATLLAYFYDHHIKRSKSLVGAVGNN